MNKKKKKILIKIKCYKHKIQWRSPTLISGNMLDKISNDEKKNNKIYI